MSITSTSSNRKTIALSLALMLALLLALPATGFCWGPGKGECNRERCEQRFEEVRKNLNLDENQNKLWENMKTSMMELRELSLKQGDNLDSDSRRRTKARNHLLMRAELAAETPEFKAVGEKLKAEYKGNLAEKFNQATDARVAFFSSLNQKQRDTMFKQGRRGSHRGGKGKKGRRGMMQ